MTRRGRLRWPINDDLLDADLYERLMQGATPPLDREIDEVVHAMLVRFYGRWDYAVSKIEALAEDCDLRGWTKQGNYVRMHVRRMEAER